MWTKSQTTLDPGEKTDNHETHHRWYICALPNMRRIQLENPTSQQIKCSTSVDPYNLSSLDIMFVAFAELRTVIGMARGLASAVDFLDAHLPGSAAKTGL